MSIDRKLLRLGVVALFSLLTACGSGGEQASTTPISPPPPPQPPPPTANNPPEISGSPQTIATSGQPYSFLPNASDADSDTLTFSINPLPAWATFDTATGNLAGTPGDTHVGVTSGIMISVSDGQDSASLAPFDLEVRPAPTGSATVSWEIPTTNADGTTLTDLAGFRIHYGSASQNYTDVLEVVDETSTSAIVDDLAAGTWYFAVTAVDESDNESAFSVEVFKDVNP